MKDENKKIEKETKEKNSTNKILIISVILILIVLIGVFGIIYGKKAEKENKAKEAFGEDNCNVVLHMATMDLAPHTCKICGATFEDSSMHEDICKQCAEDTNRCDFCGKKMTTEIKEQRQNLIGNNVQ